MAAEIITNALKYKRDQLFCTIDYETCNLNLITPQNLPWNVGIVISQGAEIKDVYNLYIKWPNGIKISADAARITRYDPSIVEREGKDPFKVLQFIEQFLYDSKYRILGYNYLQFDQYIHSIFRRNLGLTYDYSYIDRCIDCFALFKAYKLNIKLQEDESLYFWMMRILGYYQRGLKSSLTAACKELNVKVDESMTHSASYDVVQTFLVFRELIKHYEIK
jgi:hypothetical protein